MRTLLAALAWLVLLSSAVALADDACLSGVSSLGDRRGLESLRADVDASCPCASAASRGAYQRCARAVIRDAVDAGTLRQRCRSTATRIVRGAVCGSTDVACGRFKPAARDPRSCRVKKPARCHDSGRFDEEPCANETHCADVVDWTASTCIDVRASGPFDPGVRVVPFTKQTVLKYCTGGSGDCSAQPFGPGCRCGGDGECQSNVCEKQSRTLDTAIWYPAPAGSGSIQGPYDAIPDAPLAAGAAPFPLVLFSHGSCGYPYQSTFLTALLATHGFVVAAPPHPGNTVFEFPACGSPAAQVSSAAERPADVIFVLDQMLAADQDPGSPFYGAIDESRVGMSGHSFGGFTTYLVVAEDARFRVALPMAPAVPGSPVLTVPSLTMLGSIDSVVSDPTIRAAYDAAHTPKFSVEIADAGHYAFSNFCFPSPDCNPPTTLTQDEAHELVVRYALPFLEVYLAGDLRFLPFLAPPGVTGVTYDAQP